MTVIRADSTPHLEFISKATRGIASLVGPSLFISGIARAAGLGQPFHDLSTKQFSTALSIMLDGMALLRLQDSFAFTYADLSSSVYTAHDAHWMLNRSRIRVRLAPHLVSSRQQHADGC